MERKKEKVNISVSIDPKLSKYMEELFHNKSRYIEWLIQRDLIENGKEEVKKLIL